MKRFLTTLIAAVTLFGMASCVYVPSPKGEKTDLEVIKEPRTVPFKQVAGFNAISVKQGIKVNYIQAGEPSIKVFTNIKDPKLLNIHVEDNELIVEYQSTVNRIDGSVHTQVDITGYDITDIEVSSGGEVAVDAAYISQGTLELDGSSSGSITFANLTAGQVKMDVSSGAEIKIAGKAQVVEADASSGGMIGVSKIIADEVYADASSGANIELSGTAKRVSYDASSGADIEAAELIAETGEAKASSGASISAHVKQLNQKSGSGGTVENAVR